MPMLQAQAPAPAFEVASIKPNKSNDGRIMLGMQPGGRFTATNATLRLLVRQAYGLQDFQIVGGPTWLDGDHFDIVAKAEGDIQPTLPGTTGPLQLMLRALLVERFKLVAHSETRDLPIYALVLARTDGKLGPSLAKSTTDCAAMAAARGRGGVPPALPPGPLAPGQRPMCGIMIGPGKMGGGGFPLSQLANTLGQMVQRTVVDRTGLTGIYDFDLTWTPDQVQQGTGGGPPLINGAPIDPNGPSIYTAVQEQLGLKLDSQRGPVDVVVIDSVAQPTPD